MSYQTVSDNMLVCAVRDQVSCTVQGEAVILHLDDGVYYGLNPVGTFIWNRLKAPQRVGDLAAIVAAEFDVSLEQCAADIHDLLVDLLKNGLIEVVTEPTA
ncbi:MAG TPA: PqqD family protein [Terriglobales bacterium]|nr:PqqD family protein [Terriglobales bacterium]